MPEADNHTDDLDLLREAAVEAGTIALRWFRQDPQVWMKQGDSPVSEADFTVDRFLRETLRAARPDYGWLSEESEDDLERLQTRRTFVVDPIDGTRGFIAGQKQWCVSIAIVEDGRPVAGVLECPALQQTFCASADGQTKLNGKAIVASLRAEGATTRVTGPRSFQAAIGKIGQVDMHRVPFVPSLAYRLAMIATGEVDIALARGSAQDWDLAAADLIVERAGGRLSTLDGAELAYNRRDVRHGTLVASPKGRHDEMLDLARLAMDKVA
ncbi:MAG: 3'(2'),5'-bisphosphate nucleotidase CysQ [Ahrensia sp.]|nr:3'(2'),5'-bisphosphate nucleotidase CysQ [Ahrensia sp.]